MKTGLYIHYPICASKCRYCDFNSVALKNIAEEDIVDAIIRDMNYYYNLIGKRDIDTIYFGGGTPSLMNPSSIKKIIKYIHKLFIVKNDAEITLETNPITAEINKFRDFKDAGINRISIGVQSFSPEGLKYLGRTHDVSQAEKALDMASKTFDKMSFDLMYGWKGQTLEGWKQEVEKALSYEKGHISMYQLTIYEGTPLFSSGDREVSDNMSLEMQKIASEILQQKNIRQYEISNYARTGEESKHNLLYWHYDDYIGIGVGASGRLTVDGQKISFKNEENIRKWLKEFSCQREELSVEDCIKEALLMGLRLNEGIDLKALSEKLNIDIYNHLNNLNSLGNFIYIENGFLKTTELGRNCLNSVLEKLV